MWRAGTRTGASGGRGDDGGDGGQGTWRPAGFLPSSLWTGQPEKMTVNVASPSI